MVLDVFQFHLKFPKSRKILRITQTNVGPRLLQTNHKSKLTSPDFKQFDNATLSNLQEMFNNKMVKMQR